MFKRRSGTEEKLAIFGVELAIGHSSECVSILDGISNIVTYKCTYIK